ncbi:phosphatidate cytidylyltransferase [Luteimonas qiangzhengi]|uniref:phosphatidate cytidylyltransferase n=1 Tax=Luteimonas sp. MJ146 TaxID=3129240 RepID=UPI0031BAAA70
MTRTRVIAALVMAPLAIAAVLLLPTPWLVALAAVALLGGLWEWLRLAGVDDPIARGTLLIANLLLILALVWASASDPNGSMVLLKLLCVAAVIGWLLVAIWLRHPGFASAPDARSRVIKLAAGTLVMVPAWCAVGLIHSGAPNGNRWLLLALAIVWAADTGAYFAGRSFGGKVFKERRLAPRISPNKTIEGMIGGLLLAVLTALVFAPLAGASSDQLPAVALVALLAAGFSVLGDLFESLLKRHAGVKDSGNLIPGHGGLLDRMDGVLAALPVFAVGQIWLGF